MIVRRLEDSQPFTTKDGSSIRPLLDRSCAPVSAQSLAEAALPPGAATTRHLHPATEEFYFLTAGRGLLEIGGDLRAVSRATPA
jgi:mannose-6-phosphate isomerase-like protein (cupin superfamily)